jgi:hypothetical protein
MDKKRVLAGLATGEAEDLLHYCLGPDGDVIPGKHFLQELEAEDLDLTDAWLVLRTGHIFSEAEVDIKTGEHKYTVEGYETAGKYLAIVFSFKEVDLAFLITVFSIESLRR